MTWPALLLWPLILAGAFARGPLLLTLFWVVGAFGTLQMVPGEAVGGANLLPQSACAAVLVGKVFLQRDNALRGLAAAIDPFRMGPLVAFLLYGLCTAIVLPRLFAGQIEVFAVSGAVSGSTLVQPSAANITQSGYMGLSIATALAMTVIGGRPEVQRHMAVGILAGGIALVATGFADQFTYAAGLGSLLEPFRNATYSLLTDVEAQGAKRVVGLMPEASAFGSACVTLLTLLALLRPCFEARLRRMAVPLTMGGLALMAAISTSSTAYVGLCVLALVFALNWLLRLGTPDALAREDLSVEFGFGVVAGFGLLCVLVLKPSLLEPVFDMIDTVVLRKTASASFAERSLWTQYGWQAFFDTGGLGVGLGSIRVSNWAVSILASTGLFGSVLLFGFLLRCLLSTAPHRSPAAREWRRALRLALLPTLAMSVISATMPDIGVATGAILGLLVAIEAADRQGGAAVPPVAAAPVDLAPAAVPG